MSRLLTILLLLIFKFQCKVVSLSIDYAASKQYAHTDPQDNDQYDDTPSNTQEQSYSHSIPSNSIAFCPMEVLCEVNGFIIPAMIDTGAQISIMSHTCAERCHLTNQIDHTQSGRAIGVGISEISGRISSLPLRIGPVNFFNQISILKHSRFDFILGMDFLRKHNCELNIFDKSMKIHVADRRYRIPFIVQHDDLRAPTKSTASLSMPSNPLTTRGGSTSPSSPSSVGDTSSSSTSNMYAVSDDDEKAHAYYGCFDDEKHIISVHNKNKSPSSSSTSTASTRKYDAKRLCDEDYKDWDEYEDPNAEFVSMEGL